MLRFLFGYASVDGAWWDRRVCVYAPLNVAGDVYTPYTVPLSFAIHSQRVSIGRRAYNTLSEELREARTRDAAYMWLLISLYGSDHANSMWVDLRGRCVAVFEPHGGDLHDVAQPMSIRGYYDSTAYAAELKRLVLTALDSAALRGAEWSVLAPSDMQPPVWGQSWVNTPTCVAWAVWCLAGATRFGDAKAFVDSVTVAHAEGTLDQMFGAALADMISAAGAGAGSTGR